MAMSPRTRINRVTVEDYRNMEIDFSDHMDIGIPNYWELLIQVAATVGLWVDDRLVFVLAFMHDGGGVCTVFVLSSVHVTREFRLQKLMLKNATRGFELLQAIYKPHRLQAIVWPNNQTHVRFIEHFGFKREGTLEDYTPAGDDVYIYGKSMRRV